MSQSFLFSIVVPTFSRTDEVIELLDSLETQQNKNFEVIIADGSLDDSVGKVVKAYMNRLKLIYLYDKGLGISESRNWGVKNASGDYVVFFDSDCVIPSQYFAVLDDYLNQNPLDAFGGPDKAHESFNNHQKAINYAMTSFFTTGGIRGKKTHIGQYQPRGFNMGIKREVFNLLGGYSGLKVSEDIDLSMRLFKSGYKVGLIEEAFVYHKRRSTFYKFFRQVNSFGSGRIDLQIRHGNALKLVHFLPTLFTLYILFGLIISIFSWIAFTFWAGSLLVYFFLLFIDSTIQNKSTVIGLQSVYAACIMHIGYGMGMLKAIILRYILRVNIETTKPKITQEA
jgi:glycosyltransferase involved in cell wall biosynthesis